VSRIAQISCEESERSVKGAIQKYTVKLVMFTALRKQLKQFNIKARILQMNSYCEKKGAHMHVSAFKTGNQREGRATTNWQDPV
jgi:hypothetical protein